MSAPSNILVIGASTGGIQALSSFFTVLGHVNAAVLLVQHMPMFINENFSRRLSTKAAFDVKLAEDNDRLETGLILVAPSHGHCVLEKNQTVRIQQGPLVNFVCPSIDVTMKSMMPLFNGERLYGVILSGMGRDGANGIAHLKSLNAITFAQDKDSCTVFGMPAEAIKTGCIDYVLSPEGIALHLSRILK